MGVPAATVIVHTAGQSIPAGVEVTRPDPLPIGTTSMRAVPGGGGRVEKFAVTSRSTSMVSAHPAVPEQAPCHPTKVEPLAGTAVSRTFALAARFCTHCALHSNAGSAESTGPLSAVLDACLSGAYELLGVDDSPHDTRALALQLADRVHALRVMR